MLDSVASQPGHRRDGRGKNLARRRSDAHARQLVDDRPPRTRGGVGQVAVRHAFAREPVDCSGGAGHRLIAHVDDTVEIQQDSAHVSIMRAMAVLWPSNRSHTPPVFTWVSLSPTLSWEKQT